MFFFGCQKSVVRGFLSLFSLFFFVFFIYLPFLGFARGFFWVLIRDCDGEGVRGDDLRVVNRLSGSPKVVG